MYKQTSKLLVLGFSLLLSASAINAQNDVKPTPVKQTPDDAKAKSDAEADKKAAEWVTSLNLNNAAKEEKVRAAIATHLKAIRDWHNEHPPTTVPAGINPATGNKLSDLDRQIIASSAIPK